MKLQIKLTNSSRRDNALPLDFNSQLDVPKPEVEICNGSKKEGQKMAKPILLIEDDSYIAEALRYSLEAQRFETRVVNTGREGLSAGLDQERPPLLILLDQLLPGMNGLEICRRLRREPSTAQ